MSPPSTWSGTSFSLFDTDRDRQNFHWEKPRRSLHSYIPPFRGIMLRSFVDFVQGDINIQLKGITVKSNLDLSPPGLHLHSGSWNSVGVCLDRIRRTARQGSRGADRLKPGSACLQSALMIIFEVGNGSRRTLKRVPEMMATPPIQK